MCRLRGENGRRTCGRIAGLIVCVLALPGRASAQSEPVFRAILNLHATLEGPYGDEGPDVSRRFDELMQAVAGRDRSVPSEPVGESQGPIAAYLMLTRSPVDAASLTGARVALRDAVQDVIHGRRTQPPSRFPQAALIDAVGSGTPRFSLARYSDVFESVLRGEKDEAIARMKAATATDPLIGDAASRSEGMRQAAASLRRGSLRDAIGFLEMLVKAAPTSSEAHRMLATALGLAGDSRTSAQHFQTALKIRRDDERSWMGLANMQADVGAIADAARTLEQAVTAVPRSGQLRWRLAGLLVRLDRVDDALVHYTEAERLTSLSNRAAVHQAVATSASMQLDFVRAAEAAERRMRADLNDAAAHRDFASVYVKQGLPERAFPELAIAAWLDPGDPLTLVMLGQSLMAERRDEDAVAVLERAVARQPDLRDARYALAQALTRASRRDEAERQLAEFERQRTAAVAREQREIDIAAAKADAAKKSGAGQHRQAIDTWKKVIGLEPTVAQNYLELAEALVKAGQLAESVEYFVKTAELDGVADVHRRLADVLARLGRTRESALAHETYERLRLEDFRRRSGS